MMAMQFITPGYTVAPRTVTRCGDCPHFTHGDRDGPDMCHHNDNGKLGKHRGFGVSGPDDMPMRCPMLPTPKSADIRELMSRIDDGLSKDEKYILGLYYLGKPTHFEGCDGKMHRMTRPSTWYCWVE